MVEEGEGSEDSQHHQPEPQEHVDLQKGSKKIVFLQKCLVFIQREL
jgi:hypothetical protein